MGKYIRPLSDAVFTIASDDLVDREFSDPTITHHGNLPNMQRVVGMPDLHPGRGYPIGAAFFSAGRFYPHWSAMISAAAWRYGKQIFSLANTTPISLKSDYQLWMTLLKKAGWEKPAVSICTASVAQLAWLYRWRKPLRRTATS